ncbi:MAG: 4-phosphoerythronate dehydrogenase [SAR86 cluster bacterium]|uniref:Erythronate-4-phosphate dehydrogenase n=1 Tax=SAR86 cluster bacterium TaxID=2030880 RepID=A0A2A4WTL5_9GAMM|nr:MAG: 4-phosphoerythronate dehydrogenase [SAR86 cluster bacterium]
MKIFADKNILAVQSNFSRHGELHFFDGRSVSRADLIDADALLVRSITPINESLLDGTKIRFVGTATSGIDHVDTAYLLDAGIHFVDAKGSNANAVVDYCFTALAFAALHRNFSLPGSRIGIVGAGAVGGLFATKLEKLGIEVRCHDPFLALRGEGNRVYYSLQEVLDCDVVSLHVPLTTDGPHPTRNLLGAEELTALRKNAILINACRGCVVDELALKPLLSKRDDIMTVFDVWAYEPTIDSSLAQTVDIATPHIAGYSKEAKSNATKILARAFEEHFRLSAAEEEEAGEGNADVVAVENAPEKLAQWSTLLTAFPLDKLSEQFKQALNDGVGPEAFDSFRQKLLQRREFTSRPLGRDIYSLNQQEQLIVLGFRFE